MRKIMECLKCEAEFTHKQAFNAIEDKCFCPECGSDATEYTCGQQIINAFVDDNLFTYLDKNGYEMSRETLLRITKELAYGYETARSHHDKDDMKNIVIESLSDFLVDYNGPEDPA